MKSFLVIGMADLYRRWCGGDTELGQEVLPSTVITCRERTHRG